MLWQATSMHRHEWSGELTKLTMTVEEAGHALGVSRNTIYQLVRSGRVPAIRLGRRWIVPRAQFERFLAGELQ